MRAARTLTLLSILFTGACAGPAPTPPTQSASVVHAHSITAIQNAARASCSAAGYSERSGGFARCVAAYHAQEAARARAEAKSLMRRAAERQGLCIDPIRFELSRCVEI